MGLISRAYFACKIGGVFRTRKGGCKTVVKTQAKNPRFILAKILAKMLAKSLPKILAKFACKIWGYGRVFFRGEKGGLFEGSKKGRNRIQLIRWYLEWGESIRYSHPWRVTLFPDRRMAVGKDRWCTLATASFQKNASPHSHPGHKSVAIVPRIAVNSPTNPWCAHRSRIGTNWDKWGGVDQLDFGPF
jgi:hypothetical protein